jgi:hypothetical protein
MSKKFKRRIFIKNEESFHDFMWADLTTDQSVVIGLSTIHTGIVKEIFDPIQGHLYEDDIYKKEGNVAPKFTFHVSGYYKGEGSAGIDPVSLDRPTIKGFPLNEITEPKRMLEILLPKNLCRSKHLPKQDDLVLSLNSGPQIPIRCVVTCMSLSKFKSINWNNARIIENSTWETHDALSTNLHAWVWTLGQCTTDSKFPSDFYVALIGEIRWGRKINGNNVYRDRE